MNESMPSIVQPPHAAQKLRTWFCVKRRLPGAIRSEAALAGPSRLAPPDVSVEILFTKISFAPALLSGARAVLPTRERPTHARRWLANGNINTAAQASGASEHANPRRGIAANRSI